MVVEGAPVSSGREARVTEAGDCRFFAGWRSDPFLFDVDGALNDLKFTGKDYFADKDVCRIVLAVFLPGEERDAYLAAEQADDARFVPEIPSYA